MVGTVYDIKDLQKDTQNRQVTGLCSCRERQDKGIPHRKVLEDN